MLLTLKDVKKIFGSDLLFENLNFEIKEKDRIGLVGRNGSGKTTIFKLITELEVPDKGQVFKRKNATIGYLSQIPEFDGLVADFLKMSFQNLMELKEKMTVLEQKMLDPNKFEKALQQYGEVQEQFSRLGGYEIDSKLEMVTNGLRIPHLLNQSFEQLSGGEKTKVGLAKVLLEEPTVLLLDEPTNHLDLPSIEWLENYLKDFKGACCIISHDRYFLDEVVTKVADLESGEITLYHGNYSAFVNEKEERLLAEFKAFQEQQKKLKKMKEAIKRLRQWANQSNPPNAALHKRARNMERAIERMEKLDRPILDPKKMNLSFHTDQRSGKDVVRLEGIGKTYQDVTVLQNLDLHIRYQDRLAIVGPNGSGKSTLLHIIMEEEKPSSGNVHLGAQVKIGYLSQQPLHGVDPNMKMIDYFRSFITVTEGQAREILSRFMFYGYSVFQKVSQLSGGERMRLKLSIFMHQDLNLLILDEPTNHLDVDSQEVLEDALEQFTGTVLCVSHDRYFLNNCFHETAYLLGGKLHRFIGNYDETKEKAQSVGY
ncbi:ATPase subunit of ABC transporter with duplicated ATPase domains [Salirhabdus euzebyi]|uniref:ATPase subunit of ABC transporter with duplicated ATPase domains n=1 Tax=Salirhabdus euzebyi TaxID=394506 RepID=A0A841Q5S9_9BACI|nr:ABC-F family ATP-binding cassette domain-containing protein [Salirhabdus euzebyi]MBB6453829.1 ATPase subunit of ABC transporter with duplicated ATPase domains [Salirhabdus euzebyi]